MICMRRVSVPAVTAAGAGGLERGLNANVALKVDVGSAAGAGCMDVPLLRGRRGRGFVRVCVYMYWYAELQRDACSA